MPVIRHPKRRGEWVELQFMARAAAHGLTVSKPWGDSARYDVVVEHAGRFLRVQIKSTMHYMKQTGRRPTGCYICNTVVKKQAKAGDAGVRYRRSKIDFFGLYIIPEDVWYIFPAEVLLESACGVALNPYSARSKYFRYLEAWHLLTSATNARPGPARHTT